MYSAFQDTPFERAEHYRYQAAKVHDLAETVPVGKSRDQLLDPAKQYELLAAGVEEVQS